MEFLGLHFLDIIVLLIYLVVILWLGKKAGEGNDSTDEFFLAGLPLSPCVRLTGWFVAIGDHFQNAETSAWLSFSRNNQQRVILFGFLSFAHALATKTPNPLVRSHIPDQEF